MAVLVATMMCALGANAQEAYACYTSSNTTLTFYYDSQRSSRTGTTYDLNTGSTQPGWNAINSSLTKVVFDSSFAGARPTSTYYWFNGMEVLQSITGIGYLNTSEVTNMTYMFANCEQLTSLDVSCFNTAKVTSMNNMFYYCSNLTTLDLSSFNTTKVKNMSNMFNTCRKLETIYVSDRWSTKSVTLFDKMFRNCTSLVGGQGTTYDANHIDAAYAHIDGGTSNPGYFTEWKEAYACYTPSNTTLTFYYDNQRSSRTGTTYDLNEGSRSTIWDTDGTKSDVTKVVFDPSFADARPTTTCDWFYGMTNLQSITGMSYLNTSEVTHMNWMFYNCKKLTSLDVSHFNTSKVIYMNLMFYGCTGLTSLDLSSFNTSNVTDMRDMFYNSYNLRTIYVSSGWSTAAVTYSDDMFWNCYNLVGCQGTTYRSSNPMDKTYAHIDGGTSNPGYFTEWKEAYACYTSENTTLTFYCDNQRNSRSGTTYDLNESYKAPGWEEDGSNTYVTKVVFKSSFADARPMSTYDWFYEMKRLQSITGIEYLNTSEVTIMFGMFGVCEKLTSLDLSGFNTAQVTDMGAMFYECSNLQTIYVGNGWNTAAVANSAYMFYKCTKLVGGQGTTYSASHMEADYAHIDGGASNPGYLTAASTHEAYACYTPSNTTLTFYYDNQRSSRSGTTYSLNTGTNAPGWESDGSNAYVTKVVFDPSFADARPTTTYDWFYNMENLQSITGMGYLNTSEVTNMAYMFMWCTGLTSLDVSRFNASKVTSMRSMFKYCTRLTSLDLGSFNTSKVNSMYNMFYDCDNLRTIYVGNGWSTAAVTSSTDMFLNCSSLKGGQGTTYDASHVDKTYAHIDYGSSNPGYFTDAATGIITHIEAVPAKANTVKGIYTLDGRKLNELPTQKGIYIIDGRRMVIK